MTNSEKLWLLEGDGSDPVVACALHDGHEVRDEILSLLAVDSVTRLKEEDPCTGDWTRIASTRIVGLRSRFEVDLNRPREKAVYRSPEDAWGLDVYKNLPEEVAERSLALWDDFYSAMRNLFTEMSEWHGSFVILDLHSYNHRRDGPGAVPADSGENPEVNIGTGTMRERDHWGTVIDRFMEDLRGFDYDGGHLDVRENVRFMGGYFAKWIHENFPDSACVLSVEFKKFFMDEWTGEPDLDQVGMIESALESTIQGSLDSLERLNNGG